MPDLSKLAQAVADFINQKPEPEQPAMDVLSVAGTPEDEYMKWVADPSPDNMGRVLRSLNPTINAEIGRYPGPKTLLRGHGRRLAVQAIKRYDPSSQAKLRSWVVTSLQPLTRIGNQLSQQVHYPEVAKRQAAELNTVRQRLWDELGDDPSDEQLADEMSLSVKRVSNLKRMIKPVVSQDQLSNFDDDGVSEPIVTKDETDPKLTTAMEMVWPSLNKQDQQIMNWRTGFGGSTLLDNASIAKRQRVSPAYVSQRAAQISQMILETMARV